MNTYKYIKISLIAFVASITLFGAFSSCTERIDIKTDDAEPRLVIYGYITSETKQHSIKISRSSGYFATSRPEGISNAIVTISDDENTFTLLESSTEAGLYQTAADVAGVEGKTYTLNVLVDFDGTGQKQEYTATSYLPLAPEVDEIAVQQSDISTHFLEVLLWGKIPDNEDNYLSFHVYKNDKIVNDSLVNFSIIDDEYIDQKVMTAVPCFYLDQKEDKSKLEKGDIVTLRVDVFTKEYGKFIENAQAEARGSIPIFSGPPANIETNIKATNASNTIPISGFFSAYSGRWASTTYE